MLQGFCQYITDNELFLPGQKILLAVSGGMDSVAMAHLFAEAGFDFAIAHCNFRLRGEESEGDEAFVQKLAEKYNVPFYRTDFDTLAHAGAAGISIQMAARDLRYDWLNQVTEENGFTYFATAHHKNDIIETILLNLTRGTGIYGLAGIRMKVGKTIRPLLFAGREEIENYIRAQKLNWREDSSNASVKYRRNLLRHEVIPVLKKINPALENTFEETSEKIRAAENIFLEKIADVRTKICHRENGDFYISIAGLQQEKEKQILLFELIREFGFNYSDTRNLLATDQAGKKIESPTHIAIKDREYFIISALKKPEEQTPLLIEKETSEFKAGNLELAFRIVGKENFTIPANSDIACLDLEKLSFPLVLRNWKQGDWLIPLGLGRKKKVSDLLIDHKVPLIKKNGVKVLVSGESIVWVIGLRLDDRFKVNENTNQILVITSSTAGNQLS